MGGQPLARAAATQQQQQRTSCTQEQQLDLLARIPLGLLELLLDGIAPRLGRWVDALWLAPTAAHPCSKSFESKDASRDKMQRPAGDVWLRLRYPRSARTPPFSRSFVAWGFECWAA